MSTAEVDAYIAALDEPRRSTLEHMRQEVLAVVPTAEQGISYGVPVFRVDGVAVAGLSAARGHLSYLPHSGSVVAALGAALDGHPHSKGAVRFPVDQPLPGDLVRALIEARLAEARGGG